MTTTPAKPRRIPPAKVREAEAKFLEACEQTAPSSGWQGAARLGSVRRRWAEEIRHALKQGGTLQPETRERLVAYLDVPGANGPAIEAASVLRLDPTLDAATLDRLLEHSYYNSDPAGEFMAHPAMTPARRAEVLAGPRGRTMRQKLLNSQVTLPEGLLRQVYESFGVRLRNWWPDIARCPQCPPDLLFDILAHPQFAAWDGISRSRGLRQMPEVRERLMKHLTGQVALDLLDDRRPDEFQMLVRRLSTSYERDQMIARLSVSGVPAGAELFLDDLAPSLREGDEVSVRRALDLPATLLSDLTEDESGALPEHATFRDLPRARNLAAENNRTPVLIMLLKEGHPEDFSLVAGRLAERDTELLVEWLEQNEMPPGARLNPVVLTPVFASGGLLAERAMRVLHRFQPAPATTLAEAPAATREGRSRRR